MKKFKSYAQKPFSYVWVGKEKVRKFGENHIIVLEKADIAPFSEILADTKSIYTDMFGSIVSRDEMETGRQAATIQLNQKSEEFKAKAIDIEPLIAFKLKKSGFYEEFYPHGTTEIHGMSQANATTLMNRFEKACTKHATALGYAYAPEFAAIRLAYESAVVLQKGLIGNVKLNIPDFEEKQQEFFDQIYKNILVIAAYYYKTPEKMLAFFDETILEVRKHTTADGGDEPFSMEIGPNSTTTANINFTATDIILLSNVSSDAPVFYYGGNTPNQAPATEAAELAAGEEIEIPAATLGKYLIIQNKDMAATAEVEIMLL